MFFALAAGFSCEWDHCLGLCLPWLNRRWHGSSPQLYTIFFTGFEECDWNSSSLSILELCFMVHVHADSFRFKRSSGKTFIGRVSTVISCKCHHQAISRVSAENLGVVTLWDRHARMVSVFVSTTWIYGPRRSTEGGFGGLSGPSVLTGCGWEGGQLCRGFSIAV